MMRVALAWASVALAAGPALAAARIDLAKPASLTRDEEARKYKERAEAIKAGDYQRAWDACTQLLLNEGHYGGGHRHEEAKMLAQIALVDPKVAENGRERLEVLIDLLKQFDARATAQDEAERRAGTPGRLTWKIGLDQMALQFAVLAMACKEERKAEELIEAAAGYALLRNIAAMPRKDLRDALVPFLKRLLLYLVVFGKTDRAVQLIQRHWEQLGDEQWKAEGAPKTEQFIRGCALLQVANLVEETGNLPAAARLLLRAYNSFGFDTRKPAADPREEQVFRQALLACAKVKAGAGAGEYSRWTDEPLPKYEDTKVLRKTFQALLDQLADAYLKQDVEGALKLFSEPEKVKKVVTQAFGQEPRFRSLSWTVQQITPVKTTDTRAFVECECTGTRVTGEKRSGPKPFLFVRSDGNWKLGDF
ncbi:MAG: hypothetical protein FJ290_09155 [Planctomycetes bacterium]|nr:hypothetical protein [Planctomycetota bacterium]